VGPTTNGTLFNKSETVENLPYDDLKTMMDDAANKVNTWPAF
jgi:hypothetical protein